MAKSSLLQLALVATLICLVAAQESLPLISNAFGDNMVIQGNHSANIWGWTKDADSMVKMIIVRGSRHDTYFSGAVNHKWSITFEQPISFEPSTITVSTFSGQSETASLKNVLFGYVFICGGQSNMEMAVSGAFNASTEIPQGDAYPNIRLFTAGQGTTSASPLQVFKTIEQPWSVASSQSIGKGTWEYFSATCWFFGRDLYQQVKVPIGLMSINWGGTYIQTWSSPAVQKQCSPDAEPVGKSPNEPMLLYNAMLSPVFGMGVNGILWYQGESNIGWASTYECFFPAMIKDWRRSQVPGSQSGSEPDSSAMSMNQKHDDDEEIIPFLFVQLSPYTNGLNTQNYMSLPAMREAQLSAFKVPGVSGVTAMDSGDSTSPLASIHPRNKQVLGRRLASAMLRTYKGVYGIEGPILTSANRGSAGNGPTALLSFTSESPLTLVPATCPSNVDPLFCTAFQIRGTDGNWVEASPSIVTSSGTPQISLFAHLPPNVQPDRVRYAYNLWPLAILYDSNNNPAWPFETPLN